ncbi:hypothetical protein HanHA300_Chr17g0642961 [Helianthus annuus]|nr:hypothetical protein HanHA300_Chr17g0642961 [Helianthus annuus]KAJ0446455.1 hypothetical protein HanHA89_Chr17g0694481 [Helianthus annuus]
MHDAFLIEAAYKTNIYKLPLVHIVDVTLTNKSFYGLVYFGDKITLTVLFTSVIRLRILFIMSTYSFVRPYWCYLCCDVCHVLQTMHTITMHTITTIFALTYPRCFCLQHFLVV